MRLILSLLCLLSASLIVAQPAVPSKEVLSQKLSTLKPHPRLLLDTNDWTLLKEAIKTDPIRQKISTSFLKEAQAIIPLSPVDRTQIGKRLLSKSRECLRRVFLLGYAFQLTQDKKYLNRAISELTAVSEFHDWNPSHFLDVAEMTMAVAIGYDWLYDQLTPSQKNLFRTAIKEKGIQPSFSSIPAQSWFLQTTNNWNQVCNAGLVWGALAIVEDDLDIATEIIQRAIKTLPLAMSVYQPSGAYPEGYAYWDYGTAFNVLLIDALEKCLGTDYGLSQAPGFLQTAHFMEYMVGPTLKSFNWGDCSSGTSVSPAMFWFAQKQNDPSLLWNELQLLEKTNYDITKNRLAPTLLAWSLKTDFGKITPPNSNIWIGNGENSLGIIRTNWNSKNALYVGFKAGSAAVNHAHMDAGSFVFDALNERWAMDFGMQDYNSLESKGFDQLFNRNQNSQRWTIFRYHNLSHNTLSIDGKLHVAKGNSVIDRWSKQPNNLFMISNLKEIFTGQAEDVTRGIMVRDESEVIIRDEIKAPMDRPITVRWNMVTPATVKVINETTVQLTQNSKTIFLTFQSDNPISIKTWTTTPPNDYDAPNPQSIMIGFESVVSAGKSVSFNSVFGKRTGASKPIPMLSEWK